MKCWMGSWSYEEKFYLTLGTLVTLVLLVLTVRAVGNSINKPTERQRKTVKQSAVRAMTVLVFVSCPARMVDATVTP